MKRPDRLKNDLAPWLTGDRRLKRWPGWSGCNTGVYAPGLIILQIDGLSDTQFQRALGRRRLPFLRHLMATQEVVHKPFYSGLPSSTPAVQAELYYGVKTAVPAFEFIDRHTRLRHAMFLPASADTMAHRLRNTGEPLLAGGSSYSNIYAGGAETARYCAETMNLESLIRATNPFRLVFFLFSQIGKLLRIAGYAGVELILAMHDFFKGVFAGKDIGKELKFIPTRLFVCAILRELIRLRVKMDVWRGVPIIAANFFGYDEQAHRRGPASAFAHWTLKGIDGVVKDIYSTAMRSSCRDYRVVIFADHGQESVETYRRHARKPLKKTIREVLDNNSGTGHRRDADDRLATLYRRAGNYLLGQPWTRHRRHQPIAGGSMDTVRITTMGPLGHLYLPPRIREQIASPKAPATLTQLACRLNRRAHIPLVLFEEEGRITAVNDSGTHVLSQNPAAILGKDHPFLDQVAADLERLCRHSNAGDLVISGWKPDGCPLSFSVESGAHGGPGTEETCGFVLLPAELADDQPFLRPMDLRERILDDRGKRRPRSEHACA
ncbi:MAG: hypothetical protein PVG51_04695 [Desulfosarcina sp.]|jgi:hypothetical protein